MATSAVVAWLLETVGVDTMTVCYWSALANGMTVTPVLFLLVLLSSHRATVGGLKSDLFVRALSWLAVFVTGVMLTAHTLLQFF